MKQKLMPKQRLTPSNVDTLRHNEIFVFGSNESGIHGAGAAQYAALFFGAQIRLGFGRGGMSFAIPTKDWNIETLPLDCIKFYVSRFIEYAKGHSNINFLVTPIGCGLAGYTPEQIAPLFTEAVDIKNIYLPEEFWNILKP